MPPLEYGAGAYLPQPPISHALFCQDAYNFYAASDGNMIVYLTLDNKRSWYLSGLMPHLNNGVRNTFPISHQKPYTVLSRNTQFCMLQVIET